MIRDLWDTEIDEILRTEMIGRLGSSVHDTTYVVSIGYAYDGNCIYGHTYDRRKIEAMCENPNVCFEVSAVLNGNWKCVTGWGVFEELTDPEERKKGIKILADRILPSVIKSSVRIVPPWPFGPEKVSDVGGIVYRVSLNEKRGRCEKGEPGLFYAN